MATVPRDYTIRKSLSVYERMKSQSFLKKYYSFKTMELIKGNEIYGSSPPDLFVGRVGYPDVYIGPMVPPTLGDTSLMGTPERWVGKTIPDIVEMRSLLIRGMHRTKVTNVDNGRAEEAMKEIALADNYFDMNVKLGNKPSFKMSFNENSQPFGPTASLKDIRIGSIKTNTKIENAYLDTDMSATEAMVELYEKGVLVSKIQKALSAGVLGRKKSRRFVPTRWSITAADDTLSKYKLKTVKHNTSIDTIRVYDYDALDNRWLVIMFPGSWEYESIEAFYPNTTWNMSGNNIDVGGSYEPYEGRKTYAEIGGCYYAARLAVSEFLEKQQKQARVLILREVHSGYVMPVGVWNVREYVRETLKREPLILGSVGEVFDRVAKKFEVPIPTWISSSTLLKNLLRQRRLFQTI